MSDSTRDFSAYAMAEAIEANYAAYLAYCANTPQGKVYDDAEVAWRITGIPRLFMNAVVHVRFAPDDLDASIERVMAPFKACNQGMIWLVTPSSRPENLGPHLEASRLVPDPGIPGMAVDLQILNEHISTPPGLTVEPVEDVIALRQWIETLGRGHERVPNATMDDAWHTIYADLGFAPNRPLRQYQARLHGELVATSEIFLGKEGVVGIYWVATIPAARRQGIGAAVTLAPLLKARAEGYRIGVLKASKLGFSVYRQLGFVVYSAMNMYYWKPLGS